MILDFQVWYKSWWQSEWVMAPVKSVHLGTKKVIIPVKGGNQSLEIGKKCILRYYAQCQDDSGDKLYTGDIVFVSNTLVSNEPTYKCEVVWDKYRFAFRIINPLGVLFLNADTFGYSVKKIGNRYENPELLEN